MGRFYSKNIQMRSKSKKVKWKDKQKKIIKSSYLLNKENKKTSKVLSRKDQDKIISPSVKTKKYFSSNKYKNKKELKNLYVQFLKFQKLNELKDKKNCLLNDESTRIEEMNKHQKKEKNSKLSKKER